MRYVIFIAVLGLVIGCTAREPATKKEADVDILEYLSKHSHKVSIIHYSDGSTYKPKYGDINLEKAEELLAGKYERPWTVSKVAQWYQETKEPKTRAALLWLLAASRDERAVSYLGSALDDPALDVRIASAYGINDYFLDTAMPGGTEQLMIAAREWWQERKSKHKK